MNELERWANFYLLMSGAAATLLGLMFVVIALAAERRSGDAAKIHIYLTPTVIYFASVFCLAALLIFPNHTRLTASLCSCLGGFAGLVYSGPSFALCGAPGNPEAMKTALYFDPVNFASRIHATVMARMGFIDTILPPAGVWTALNQIPGPEEVLP
jgi:hypothetical protein